MRHNSHPARGTSASDRGSPSGPVDLASTTGAPEVEPILPAEVAPLTRADARVELRRALEDLEAAKLRIERDARRAEEATRGRLVSELIPVLDDLDRTIAAGSGDAALLQGVSLVRGRLESVLGSYGLERLDALGARFNPAEHEAVAVAWVDNPAEDGVVTEVLSRGYRFGARVLVPVRVRVGKLRGQRP